MIIKKAIEVADAITNIPLLEHKSREKRRRKIVLPTTLSEGDRVGQAILYLRNPWKRDSVDIRYHHTHKIRSICSTLFETGQWPMPRNRCVQISHTVEEEGDKAAETTHLESSGKKRNRNRFFSIFFLPRT